MDDNKEGSEMDVAVAAPDSVDETRGSIKRMTDPTSRYEFKRMLKCAASGGSISSARELFDQMPEHVREALPRRTRMAVERAIWFSDVMAPDPSLVAFDGPRGLPRRWDWDRFQYRAAESLAAITGAFDSIFANEERIRDMASMFGDVAEADAWMGDAADCAVDVEAMMFDLENAFLPITDEDADEIADVVNQMASMAGTGVPVDVEGMCDGMDPQLSTIVGAILEANGYSMVVEGWDEDEDEDDDDE